MSGLRPIGVPEIGEGAASVELPSRLWDGMTLQQAGMDMRLRLITPEGAVQLLASQKRNRTVRKNKVTQWARDIGRGDWNPWVVQPVMLNEQGVLIDGQHRLSAVIEAGEPALMWVLTGVPDRSQARDVLDGHTPRNASDVLLIDHDVKNGRSLQAIAMAVLNYESRPGIKWNTVGGPSKTEIVGEILANQRLYADAAAAGAAVAGQVGPGIMANRTSYGTLAVLVSKYSSHTGAWADWHDKMVSGELLHRGDPRLTLRSARRQLKNGGWEGSQTGVYGCIRAWNGYVRGEKLRLIKVHSYLPMPEVA